MFSIKQLGILLRRHVTAFLLEFARTMRVFTQFINAQGRQGLNQSYRTGPFISGTPDIARRQGGRNGRCGGAGRAGRGMMRSRLGRVHWGWNMLTQTQA
jgi:hypothetical protein